MSLRLRFTLFYTLLLTGVLLLFTSVVYGLVHLYLINQIDQTIFQQASLLLTELRVNSINQIDQRSIADFTPHHDVIYQVWDTNAQLQIASPPSWRETLDGMGLRSNQPRYNSTYASGSHVRVLSIPFQTTRGPAGVLQVGYRLSLIDFTLQTLTILFVSMSLLAVALATPAIWALTGRILSPLQTVTHIASNIIRVDDLQRRIPATTSMNDEVGQLIIAFNQTLERMEKLLNAQRRFLTDVSHELRTPLTVIKGNIGLMLQMQSADQEALESINSEVDRLNRLVGDLLLLAQAESGKLPLDMRPVDMDTLLLEVLPQMRSLAGEKLKIHLVEIDQAQVMGDSDRLKQVLINIISNAVFFTPPGGKVTISMRKVANQVQITISDTGPGISAEDLPHIFERFYRGEKSRTRTHGGGFGLGLAIANWIVRGHRGTIEVSSFPGKGTTFCIWLPLKEET